MDAWTILLTVIAGAALALTVFGVIWDARRNWARRRELVEPPARTIPQFRPDAVVPQYLSELEARTGDGGNAHRMTPDQRAALRQSLAEAPSFAGGWLVETFITEPDLKWAVAPNPVVLVCADPVTSLRQLYPVLERVSPSGTPLVLVLPAIDDEVLRTLEVNHLQQNLRVVVVAVLADSLPHVAELVGADVVPEIDIAAGYLPAEALGTCAWWVSDRLTTWVVDQL